MNSYGGYTRLVCNMVKLSLVLVNRCKVLSIEQYTGTKSDKLTGQSTFLDSLFFKISSLSCVS